MPTRDEELRKRTFKGEFDDTSQRIYYTLTDPLHKGQPRVMTKEDFSPDKAVAHRTARVASDLLQLLVEKKLITEEELDEMLLAATG
jgi:hypothetical protein